MTRLLAAVRRLLHHHWPANPTCRSGIVTEVCRCGAARHVHLWLGQAIWSTAWTHDPEERRAALAAYSHEWIATR